MYIAKTGAMSMPGLCRRKDCLYHSAALGSCDYRLATGAGRGCAVEACDKWKSKKDAAPRMRPAAERPFRN